jgi:hypothetical protein
VFTSSYYYYLIIIIKGSITFLWSLGSFSVGHLGQGIGQSQGLYQHKKPQMEYMQTYINASSGIRTHDPSIRAGEDWPYFNTAAIAMAPDDY